MLQKKNILILVSVRTNTRDRPNLPKLLYILSNISNIQTGVDNRFTDRQYLFLNEKDFEGDIYSQFHVYVSLYYCSITTCLMMDACLMVPSYELRGFFEKIHKEAKHKSKYIFIFLCCFLVVC